MAFRLVLTTDHNHTNLSAAHTLSGLTAINFDLALTSLWGREFHSNIDLAHATLVVTARDLRGCHENDGYAFTDVPESV